jgi:hypothetical protein
VLSEQCVLYLVSAIREVRSEHSKDTLTPLTSRGVGQNAAKDVEHQGVQVLPEFLGQN